MENSDKNTLRLFEGTKTPALIIAFNIQKFCHTNVDKQTEDGNTPVKIRPTKPFLRELNERVYTLLRTSLENAVLDNRSSLMAQDVPSYLDFQKDSIEDDTTDAILS